MTENKNPGDQVVFKGRLTALMRPVIWSCLLAVVLYLAAIFFFGDGRILASLSRLSIWQWAILLALSFLTFVIRFMRWHYMLRCLDHSAALLSNFCYYMAGFALTTSPAKIGELVRLWYLKIREGVDYTSAFSAFVLEQTLDLVVVSILGILVIKSGGAVSWILYGLQLLIVGLLLSLRKPAVRSFWLRRVGHLASRLGIQLDAVDTSLQSLLSLRVLGVGLGLGLIAWSLQGTVFYLLVSMIGIQIEPHIAVSIFSFALLVGAVSFIPGGLGSTEAVLIMLLLLNGVSTSLAVTAAILCRIATLWFAVLVGICFLFGIESGLLARTRFVTTNTLNQKG